MAAGSPRGMRDFLPRDKERRDAVLGTIADTYHRHGFESIETPAMEDSGTLHSGLGGDNEKLSFRVMKRGLSAEDAHQVADVDELSDLGLRFDLTVPLARFYATHHADLPSVFRSFHTGPVWRAERPQKGRYRQFVQADIDTLGEASSLAEEEILLATADALTHLGVTGWSFRINDRRLLTEVLTAAGVSEPDQAVAMIVIDKLDKIGEDGVLAELGERLSPGWDSGVLGGILQGTALSLDAGEIGSMMGDTEDSHRLAGELVAWVLRVSAALPEGSVVIDPTLVRGMGYYTSSIFEISHPQLGSSLGGGGRYDGMISRFLGREVPAVGMSLGFERLLDVVADSGTESAQKVALSYDPAAPGEKLLSIKAELVAKGYHVRLVPQTRNMRAVFERLVVDGFTKVASVGESTRTDQLDWRELAGH